MLFKKYLHTPAITWVITVMKQGGLSARGNMMVPTIHHGSVEAFVLHVLDSVMEEPGESMQQLLALPSSLLTGTLARHRIALTEPITTRADADREYVSWDP